MIDALNAYIRSGKTLSPEDHAAAIFEEYQTWFNKTATAKMVQGRKTKTNYDRAKKALEVGSNIPGLKTGKKKVAAYQSGFGKLEENAALMRRMGNEAQMNRPYGMDEEDHDEDYSEEAPMLHRMGEEAQMARARKMDEGYQAYREGFQSIAPASSIEARTSGLAYNRPIPSRSIGAPLTFPSGPAPTATASGLSWTDMASRTDGNYYGAEDYPVGSEEDLIRMMGEQAQADRTGRIAEDDPESVEEALMRKTAEQAQTSRAGGRAETQRNISSSIPAPAPSRGFGIGGREYTDEETARKVSAHPNTRGERSQPTASTSERGRDYNKKYKVTEARKQSPRLRAALKRIPNTDNFKIASREVLNRIGWDDLRPTDMTPSDRDGHRFRRKAQTPIESGQNTT